MTNTLLRSGNLDDFLALGEHGKTIFHSAVQIRETLRLRRQHRLADCLAVPQPDEKGEKVDWYSPRSGKVTTWAAASIAQREHALRNLENNLSTVEKLSRQCQQNEKSPVKLFGALLENIFRFPASQHIYLVDGYPVITFWGFNALHADAQRDPLDVLRETLSPPPFPLSLSEPEKEEQPKPDNVQKVEDAFIDDSQATIVTLTQTNKPVVASASVALPKAEVVEMNTTPTAEPRSGWKKRKRKLAVAYLVALAAPAIWLGVSGYFQFTPTVVTAAFVSPEVPIAAKPITAPSKPAIISTLPLMRASVIVASAAEKTAADNVVIAEKPLPKDALVLPAASVKAGTTRFLNGNWRATIDYKDAISGKPPVLRYQINNNAGTVSLTTSENIICRTEISAGLMQSGNLVIKTRGNARCADGSRYTLPEVICTQGLMGPAQCTGSYGNETVIPVAFRKVSK